MARFLDQHGATHSGDWCSCVGGPGHISRTRAFLREEAGLSDASAALPNRSVESFFTGITSSPPSGPPFPILTLSQDFPNSSYPGTSRHQPKLNGTLLRLALTA